MLLEFSVENHRAFREKQTFSMVASAATERSGGTRVAHTGFSGTPLVLREACLFGANGSGKSSLIDAMATVTHFVRNSFRNEAGRPILAEPFLYNSKWRDKPSEFEIIFIHDETQYQYGFAITRERVTEEWLFARPKQTGRQRHLFTRTFDEQSNDYAWEISSVHLKGERDSWRAQTRPNALFLSTAVQLNADGLREPYEWLTNSFRMLNPQEFNSRVTAKRSLEPSFRARVLDFMREADFSLDSLIVEEEKETFDLSFSGMKDVPEHLAELFAALEKTAKAESTTRLSVRTVRMDDLNKPIRLSLDDESSGTQSFFRLAGPILEVLDNGWTLVVDELNLGLHPLAFQHLISLFCDPEINKRDAQLIFTTHDTTVTGPGCIDRDQIWLVEKGQDLAARLKPFSDFKMRDARTFQKNYLQGRFGAIPKISG